MTFRARLSLVSLETRENPSGPSPIDPIGGDAPPPSDPPPPAADPAAIAEAAAVAGATVPTPPPPTDPLLGNNGIYNVPLIP